MVPFSEQVFPELLEAFHEQCNPATTLDDSETASKINEQHVAAIDEVESFFAGRLWTDVLDPALEGFATTIVATPYRDTIFESAVHADFEPHWKIEAYLHSESEPPSEIERIREAKLDYLRSLRDGQYITEAAKEHKLSEIRVKSELFDYPECCAGRFQSERKRRLNVLLAVGSERVRELQQEHADRENRQAAFESAVDAQGVDPVEMNPESRIVSQLEYMNLGAYFVDWSDEKLIKFYRKRVGDALPSFFYSFFTREFYPHEPRCDAASELGRRIESALQAETPTVVPVYRASLMSNVFATLGFDDHTTHRKVLRAIITEETEE